MTGPLHGIKVLDITTNISGPSLTMILGDLGAEIIKVERPDIGDDSRKMGPIWDSDGVYFLYINRNKRSIVIDMKTPEGKEILLDLIKTVDVFVENFRYGKADKLGLSYEKMKKQNPHLIYCSLSAYGQQGPRRENPGYDAIVQADCGIMGLNGDESGPLARAPVSILDQGSAMWGAIGVISALFQREKTGVGQKVETSLYETGVFWTGYHLLSYLATGEEPKKMGSNHASFAPYGAYKTADEPIIIGVSNNSLFKKVCTVVDRQDWVEDERFKENVSRVKNRTLLNRLIEQVLETKPSNYWIEQLTEQGVPSSIVKRISEVSKDEQFHSLEMLSTIKHPEIGELPLPRLPLTLSGSSLRVVKSPPMLGEDTEDILKGVGLCSFQIQELIDKGIVQVQKKR